MLEDAGDVQAGVTPTHPIAPDALLRRGHAAPARDGITTQVATLWLVMSPERACEAQVPDGGSEVRPRRRA